jgi:predicted  nucleic acid-binding Zn-ribbon protein
MGKMDQMEADIDRLRRQRQGFAQNLPPDVLGHYDFIRSHLKDAAVAPVMDGTCQICHMSLPPQQFIELRRCEELMNCPHCQRIIYWVGYNEP